MIEESQSWPYGTYQTFITKKGVCDDLSAVYDYLLLQCGVDALKYAGVNDGLGHAWSYVTIDGVGYFIDPTWGLESEETHDLTYFMITADDRRGDFGDTMIPDPYYYDFKNDNVDFSADDDRYSMLLGGDFESIDTENKILYYSIDGEEKELHYEDM